MKIVGLSYSMSQSGSYVCVLAESRGTRRAPVIIRPGEAHSIALHDEGTVVARPLVHQLIKDICDARQLDCREVHIYRIHEGVFLTRILLSDGYDDLTFEVSVGDGLALSLIFGCTLLMDEDVLGQCGVEFDDEGEPIVDMEGPKSPMMTVEDLDEMLQGALAEEDYELAAKYRDEIARRHNKPQ